MKRRPRDVNQLGKLIADIATGETEDHETTSAKAPGGHAWAAALTAEWRKEIAAKARWKKRKAAG